MCLSILLLFLGFEAGGFQWAIGHMAQEYQLDSGIAGMLVSEKYAVMIAAPLLSGAIADHIGKKTALITGMCFFIAGCLIMRIDGVVNVVFANILIGAGYSFTECSATAILADRPDGTSSVNYSQCAFCIGAVLSPVIMENLSFHWSLSFLIPGAAFFALLYPLIKTYQPENRAVIKSERGKTGRRIGLLPIFMLAIFLYGMIENGTGYYLMNLFSKNLKVSYGAYAISAFWLAMAIGRFFAATVKQKKERLLFYYGMVLLILVCLGFGTHGGLSLLMAFCLGLFCAPLWPELMLLAAKKDPARAGLRIGCMSIAASVGGTISPAILGYSEKYLGYAAPFKVLAVTALFGVAAALMINRFTRERKRE